MKRINVIIVLLCVVYTMVSFATERDNSRFYIIDIDESICELNKLDLSTDELFANGAVSSEWAVSYKIGVDNFSFSLENRVSPSLIVVFNQSFKHFDLIPRG